MPRSRKTPLLEKLTLNHEIVNLVAGLDEFKGRWHLISRQVPDQQIAELGSRATVESVGSSTRMDGARMADPDVNRFLFGPDPRPPGTQDERAVAGYAEALEMVYDAVASENLGTEFIQRLHGVVTWYSDTAGRQRWAFRTQPERVRAFDAGGRPASVLFDAVPPERILPLMEELVSWTAGMLDGEQFHPLIVTSMFVAQFRSIHPFNEGSGRLSRLLCTWMLLRCGYTHQPYTSLERVLEESRAQHNRALARAAQASEGDPTGLDEWVLYFLRSLAAQRDGLLRRLDQQHRASRMPELSSKLLALALEDGRLTMAQALDLTGANRNTIKVHLRQLVAQGRLVRHGGGRGTWYTPA